MVGRGPVKTCQNSLWVIVAHRRAHKQPGVDVLIWYHTQEFLRATEESHDPWGDCSVCHKHSRFGHRSHGQGSSSHSHHWSIKGIKIVPQRNPRWLVGDTEFEGVRKERKLITSLAPQDVGFRSIQRQWEWDHNTIAAKTVMMPEKLKVLKF